MLKLLVSVGMLFNILSVLSACASSNPTNDNFLPATYDVPIDLDTMNQQNSPNM